jgi:stage II sporulation SpoE-like protein/GAF domain-containing protein
MVDVGRADNLVRIGLLARAFSGPLDVGDTDGVRDVVLQQVMKVLGATTGAFVTVAPNGSLQLVASVGITPDLVGQYHELDVGSRLPVTDAIRFREPVWIRSRRDRVDRYPQLAAMPGNEASVSLPLVVGGDVRGAIAVGFDEPRDFDESERFSIRTIAHLSALALERAGAPIDLRAPLPPAARPALAAPPPVDELLAELAHERETVDLLQRALLPGALPAVPGYQMAARAVPAGTKATVGGDWYDAFLTRDGDLAIAIGDVAGHGVRSAAAMAQLRHALRAYAFAGNGPGATLALLDELVTLLAPEAFATATMLVCTPGGDVTYARAGHPFPLLAHEGVVRLLDDGGRPPLGAGPAPQLEGHCSLAEQATLVLYTDGLVEQRGVGLDIGFGALLDVARALGDSSPNRWSETILAACPGGRDPIDDVCVVVVRRCATDTEAVAQPTGA